MKRVLRRVRLDLSLRTGHLQPLFLFAHMRSGSSLLVHLLVSNPEIVGFGEAHCRYAGRRSLLDGLLHIYDRVGAKPGSGRYVLDKMVQNKYVEDISVLGGARVLFLTRPPERTLDSILELGLDSTPTLDDARFHYEERMEWMLETAGQLDPSTWTHVDYTDIVDDTERTLVRLTQFLGLAMPLSSEYETDWYTAKRHIGDSSENIKSGQVTRPRSRTTLEGMKAAAVARSAYEETVRDLHSRDRYR